MRLSGFGELKTEQYYTGVRQNITNNVDGNNKMVADALAAAICHIHSSRMKEILKNPSSLRHPGRGMATLRGTGRAR